MAENNPRSVTLRYIVGAAAFCIVVAGMKLAAGIIVPVLLALVIAVICLPTLKLLQNRGVPTVIAISLILLAVTAIGSMVPLFVGASLRQLAGEFGEYHKAIQEGRQDLVENLTEMGLENADKTLDQWLVFDPASGKKIIESAAAEFAVWFAKAFIILILVAFMLAEASHFHNKMQAAFPESKDVERRVATVIENIWRYLAIKTVVSLVTGGLVAIMLALIGVKFALLWGFVAYCLNYIPNVGSVIAAIPAVLLALLDIGVGAAILVGVGYLAINNVLGSVIEPRLQGKGLGLSPLVVLISLLFWGFVLGIVGALLSAPLTMAVRIACEAFPETQWIAVMLGPKVKEKPPNDSTQFA